MPVDFSRWAVFAPKSASGFGRQADDIRAVLGVRHHLVADYENMPSLPPAGPDEQALHRTDDLPRVLEVLGRIPGLQGIVFFERFNWNAHIFAACQALGVKTVCVPNWEWFDGRDRTWHQCDLLVCPSEFTLGIVRGYGFEKAVCLPWAFDLGRFPGRVVTGPARVFVHNAGLVDVQDRKGTIDTIEAFKRVRRRDVRLIVRMQREARLPRLDDRIDVQVGNLAEPSALYATGDVAIQPSKMEGVGFMVIEPVASGIPTLTLDYPPMNTYVRHPQMRIRKRWFKRRAFSTQWVPHAHLRLPDRGDLAARIAWCAENSLETISRENRTWAETVYDRQSLCSIWVEALSKQF